MHYHLYEQGSGPWARALVHGIPLVSCKIFTIFFSSKLLIFYNFSRKDQFSSSSSSVNEGCCEVRKFVKSQLRAKRYQLKLTEVYPVPPEKIEIAGDIRGIEPVEVEDDSCHEVIFENQSNSVPGVDVGQSSAPVVLAEHRSAGLMEEESRGEGIRDSVPDDVCQDISESMDELHVSEAPVEVPVVETPVVVPRSSEMPAVTSRRSGRQLSKPAWMQSGEYDMEM